MRSQSRLGHRRRQLHQRNRDAQPLGDGLRGLPQPPARISKADFLPYIETHYSEFVGPIAPGPQFSALLPLSAASSVSEFAGRGDSGFATAASLNDLVLLAAETSMSPAIDQDLLNAPLPAVSAAPSPVTLTTLNVQSLRTTLLASRLRR